MFNDINSTEKLSIKYHNFITVNQSLKFNLINQSMCDQMTMSFIVLSKFSSTINIVNHFNPFIQLDFIDNKSSFIISK